MIKLIFLVLIGTNAYSVNWLCTEEASQRIGNTIKACGIGENVTENTARLQALENAKKEFFHLCSASADCKGHQVVLDPKRTECQLTKMGFVCHRLVEFTIRPATGDGFDMVDSDPYPKIYTKLAGVKHPSTKKEVLYNFGYPFRSGRHPKNPSQMRFYYQGKLCVSGVKECFVEFEGEDAARTQHINPKHVDLLD